MKKEEEEDASGGGGGGGEEEEEEVVLVEPVLTELWLLPGINRSSECRAVTHDITHVLIVSSRPVPPVCPDGSCKPRPE